MTEDKLRLDEGRLLALLTLSEMSEASEHEITDFAMEAGVKLTRSSIGYLAFMNEDESVLTMHSWSKTAMDECAIIDRPIVYPVETTGLWGEAVRQRKPIITNDYAAPSALKKGYPAGHVRVGRHMNIPVFDGERIVAVAGVGNKEEPYDESDVMQLRLLMDGMWRLLQRMRSAEKLQRAYDDLEQRVQDRTVELSQANARLTLEVIERQRAEEKIAHQADELARSNAELERFAYVASHDLQEPLRKILAFGDRLKAKAADCINEEAHDYLDRMQGAAGRMQTLINDLLSYARVTTRAHAFVTTGLNEIVQAVLADLELAIEGSGAEINVGELPTLQADPTQMRQLFQNLIGNALKFRREGVRPVVSITADLLPPDSPDIPDHTPGRRYCQILVEDNGIGFEDRFVERIFDVFQRLHSRDEYAGTGIGLAVCRKIVDRHGGTITARSVLGEGSTFVVVLPCGPGEGGGTQ
jgi:two-component system phosphate regulon sensor histidine kinase PhoR